MVAPPHARIPQHPAKQPNRPAFGSSAGSGCSGLITTRSSCTARHRDAKPAKPRGNCHRSGHAVTYRRQPPHQHCRHESECLHIASAVTSERGAIEGGIWCVFGAGAIARKIRTNPPAPNLSGAIWQLPHRLSVGRPVRVETARARRPRQPSVQTHCRHADRQSTETHIYLAIVTFDPMMVNHEAGQTRQRRMISTLSATSRTPGWPSFWQDRQADGRGRKPRSRDLAGISRSLSPIFSSSNLAQFLRPENV
jgi:hypothetical protein